MAIIIDNVEQNTPEWFALRVGIPTASNFDRILTPTGKQSTQARMYALELIAEKYGGEDVDKFQGNQWTERGHVVETEARMFYELVYDLTVKQVGFVYLDESKAVGCSPDGLIGDDGGLEIKCLKATNHFEMLLDGIIPTKFIPQVQGSLWVTGRQWWDLLGYHPKFKHFKIQIERDDVYIRMLESAVNEFNKMLMALEIQVVDKIQEK